MSSLSKATGLNPGGMAWGGEPWAGIDPSCPGKTHPRYTPQRGFPQESICRPKALWRTTDSPASPHRLWQHHPRRVNSLEDPLQMHPPRDLADQNRSHPFRAQLFVDAQEVYLYHLLLSWERNKAEHETREDRSYILGNLPPAPSRERSQSPRGGRGAGAGFGELSFKVFPRFSQGKRSPPSSGGCL